MGERRHSAFLERHDLVDAALVTPPSERRRKERIHNIQGPFDRRRTSAETQDVGIVVLSAQARAVAVSHLYSTDTGHLVRGDRHPHACPADENASVALSRRDALGDSRRIVGVVDRGVRRRSEIVIVEVAFVEGLHDPRLELDTGVIRAQRDTHTTILL